MKHFEVGYWKDPVCSVNLIWANTGAHELDAVKETALRHAERHGYEVLYVKEITEDEANEKRLRGMPYYSIDEEAEHKYDPSFAEPEPEPKPEPEPEPKHDKNSLYSVLCGLRDYAKAEHDRVFIAYMKNDRPEDESQLLSELVAWDRVVFDLNKQCMNHVMD